MLSWLSGALRRCKSRQRCAERSRLNFLRNSLRFEQLEARELLAAVSWIGSANGNWDVAANWSNNAVPTSTADVTINTLSAATITIEPGDVESVNSLAVSSNDSLLIAGGSLTTVVGLTNSGTIIVSGGCNLTVNGVFSQAATATLSMPGSGSTANPAINLATNSDFESPVIANSTTVPTGWSNWGTAYLSTQYAYTGAQSLVTSGPNSAADESFAITPGAAYTVSADAMMPAGNALTGNELGVMELLFYDSSGTLISSYTAPNAITVLTASNTTGGPLSGSVGGQGWNQFTTSAVAPSNAATAKAIVTSKINSGTGGGEVFWDDVQFGPSVALSSSPGPSNFVAGSISNSGAINISAGNNLTVNGAFSQTATATLSMAGGGAMAGPAINFTTNSDFESPVTTNSTTVPTGWAYWGTAYLSTQYAYTGEQSLLMSGANSAADETFAITPGATYAVSADAMTPAGNALTGNEEGVIELLFYNSSGALLGSYIAPNAITVLNSSSATGGKLPGSVGGQGWNQFTTSAVAPSDAATAKVIITTKLPSGTGGGEVFWDDVQFGNSSNFVAGSISNSGSITVGPSNKVITGGTFTQTSTGTLDIQLGGAPSSGQFGFVDVTGGATLGGTLKSDVVYGYTPSSTDSFTPFEFASETGTFSNYSLPGSSICQFAGTVTFTNVVISAIPLTTVTAAINANANVDAASTNLLGINLGYWNSQLGTTQTQQMVTAAGLDMYRFPGGTSADDYHFNVSNNLGDVSAETLAQFVQFISAVGGTGLLTVDYGSGSPQEAAAELAYLEGSPTDTTTIGTGIEWNDSTGQWQNVNWNTVGYWASLRGASPLTTNDGLNFLRIAHPAPFANIKYWEIGNEQYGSWETDHHGTLGPGGVSTGVQHDPATYVTFAQQFATLATEILGTAGLPGISIGIDSTDPNSQWTTNVLADGLSIGFVPGFISDHSYMQAPGAESDSALLNNTDTNPASYLDWSARYASYESVLQQTLSSKASSVVVMATEFNSVYGEPGKQTTSLVNGLFLANSIGSLLESGYVGALFWDMTGDPKTAVNNSNLLYGWRTFGDYSIFGDSTNSNPPYNGSYITYPSYYALQLASKIVAGGGEVVSATSNYGDLDVYAVKESNGHLELLVINTNPAAGLSDQFNLTGFQPSGSAQVWQYGEAQDTAQSQSATVRPLWPTSVPH